MARIPVKRLLSILGLFLALAVAFVVGWVPLPYYALGPGPARDVTPLIQVEGAPVYASDGTLIMTTVAYRRVTALQAFLAWLDPDRSLVAQEVLYPPGSSVEQEDERARSQMDQSKIDATAVVLRRLQDYPRDHGTGALIQYVGAGCPAEGELFPGDLVVEVDGHDVASAQDASRLLDDVPVDDPVTFDVEAGGERAEVEVTRGACGDADEPLLGINLIDGFPIDVTISSGDVGGPSAGLMWALGLYELLTPGDLTGGRTIAGTGTIDLRGRVGPIGDIGDKAVAARRAGADVFLVPRADLDGLDDVDTGDLEVVPVSTFAQALRFLEGASLDPS
jgi:PDZ domain-containing protein